MTKLKDVKAAERTAKAAERSAKRTNAKTERESRPRKGAPPIDLQVATTSFDFLDGAYRISRNSRLINYVILGVVAAILLTVLGSGLSSILGADSAESNLSSLEEERNDLRSELAAYGGGFSPSEVQAHIASRSQQAEKALGAEVDTLRVLNDLAGAVPSGVTIERIALPGGSTSTASSSSSSKTPVASSSKITVSANAASYGQADAWDTAVQGIEYLTSVDTALTGAEGAITITTTATLSSDVTGARVADVKSSLGIDPAASGAN